MKKPAKVNTCHSDITLWFYFAEPLSEFKTALKHSQHKITYNQQISVPSVSPEPIEEPSSFLKKQFSSALSLDHNLEDDDIQVIYKLFSIMLQVCLGQRGLESDMLGFVTGKN